MVFLITTAAAAQSPPSEVVLTEETVGVGGLICTTREEVARFIGLLESGKTGQEEIPGCGILSQPARMRIVAVGIHETEEAKYLIVRYDFLEAPIPPHFGIGARKSKGTGI